MGYKVQYARKAQKNLEKIDSSARRKIKNWITNNLVGCENPRIQGKALQGKLRTYWRYRVGAYRIIAYIKDEEITILVIDIAHRKDVYRF